MTDRGPRREQAGVLHPGRADTEVQVGRAAPPAALAAYVDYLWWVTWCGTAAYRTEVIPRPVVHVYVDEREARPRLLVRGPGRRRFDRLLPPTGRTVAAAYRPGGFRPFLGSSVSGLRGREVPATELVGVPTERLAARLADPALAPEQAAEILGDWLVGLDPPADPVADEVAALVERIEADPALTRAEQVADLAGVGVRTLQRRFAEYVGLGPKWVVQCFRLLDVAEAAHTEPAPDWAGLAAELGYADQSHLIRAFTALVGQPPATYARQR